MNKKIYKDGISYLDGETNEELIFNSYTWIKIIEGIIVNYGKRSEEEASDLINKRDFINPETYSQVICYSHDTEYHWAMLLTYGNNYWLNGISFERPDDYSIWEEKYREANSLKKNSFEFFDNIKCDTKVNDTQRNREHPI